MSTIFEDRPQIAFKLRRCRQNIMRQTNIGIAAAARCAQRAIRETALRTLQAPNIGGNDMTRLLSIALSTAAIGFFASLTPVVAQVAGNPGDIHDRTVYMMESGQVPDQFAGGPTIAGPSFFVPSFLAPAPSGCGVTQDFNGRYTSLCGL
jgi:hypothetical protein